MAGSAKGRRLEAPASVTRPTSDRAREGLFSTLEHLLGTLGRKRVLDLYAGTGAIGLEAASRGASQVDLVESDARAIQVCRRNIISLRLPGVSAHALPVEKWLSSASPTAPYDLIVMDPPYADSNERIERMLALIMVPGWLATGGIVAVERDAKSPEFSWPAGLSQDRERRYGHAVVRYATKDC
ncbi:MAG TPA: 16S rRNA (guanine(966)-N(2))-methyltransferase RsmD [Candidatus Nanopelagicaceae bacterium]|nr:16S rRNA (guanine(966)-N(2))-methyltransferase RsmD [Candidatus Nanopelagicaceae bacterium]